MSWHADPWTGGGYAWWKTGQLTAWLPELARPEGRILEAGNRAAREIAEAEGGPS